MIPRSFIRKTLVRTLFHTTQGRGLGLPGYSAGGYGGVEEEEGGCGDGALGPEAGPGDAIESAAGACVLWCTVAVGCLLKGRPKSSVSSSGSARVAPY